MAPTGTCFDRPSMGECVYCNMRAASLHSYAADWPSMSQGADFSLRFQVQCHNCGAAGPIKKDQTVAVDCWNKGGSPD